jgi:hypothetical protein
VKNYVINKKIKIKGMKNLDYPCPQYSLYDLFRDIQNGIRDTFTYEHQVFKVGRKANGSIHVSTGDLKAINFEYVSGMTDLQGIAACLLHYKTNLLIKMDGTILQQGDQFNMYFK